MEKALVCFSVPESFVTRISCESTTNTKVFDRSFFPAGIASAMDERKNIGHDADKHKRSGGIGYSFGQISPISSPA